jgi:tRNA (guanine9-N1)-methyltransferase
MDPGSDMERQEGMKSVTPPVEGSINDVPIATQTSVNSDGPIDSPAPTDKEAAPLSKNAMKRLLRKEAWEASAPERREARKLKKAAKKETRKTLISQGLLDIRDDGPGAKKRKMIESVSSGISLIIDLQFQDKMNDKVWIISAF